MLCLLPLEQHTIADDILNGDDDRWEMDGGGVSPTRGPPPSSDRTDWGWAGPWVASAWASQRVANRRRRIREVGGDDYSSPDEYGAGSSTHSGGEFRGGGRADAMQQAAGRVPVCGRGCPVQ